MKTFVLLTLLLTPAVQARTLFDCSGEGVRAVIADQDNKLIFGVQDLITKRTITKVAATPDPFVKSNSRAKVVGAYQGRTSTYAVQLVIYQAKPTGGSIIPPPSGGIGQLPAPVKTLASLLPSIPGLDLGNLRGRLTFRNDTSQRGYNLECWGVAAGCKPTDPWCGTLPNPTRP